jgi:diguanylate cyclase (GGDEF)-like protein/PAS domain S-box-containing protein
MTYQKLIEDNSFLKQRIQELEKSEAERMRAEEALRESESRYKRLLESVTDYIYTVQIEDGRPVATVHGPGCAAVTGYTSEDYQIDLYLWYRMVYAQDRDIVTQHAVRVIAGETTAALEHRIVHRDGSVRWVRNTPVPRYDEHRRLVAYDGLISNITDRKRAEEALRESEEKYLELSITDNLTNLYNSRYFYNQLQMEIDRVNRYGHPLTLLLFDIDGFKAFNDNYGHIEGDQVLWRLGQVVKRCLRQTDSAYRYGGEEFTILLPMTTSEDGVVIAERVRTEIKKEIFSPESGKNIHITVSIGLAQYRPQEDITAFVHRVDQLMYQAKKNGKDRVCPES